MSTRRGDRTNADPESQKRKKHERLMFMQSLGTTSGILKWLLIAISIMILFWLVWWYRAELLGQIRDLSDELNELRKEVRNNTEYVEETENCTEALCPFVDEILFRDFLGCWDGNTNTNETLHSPAIISSTCQPGQFYRVCVAGTTLIDGEDNWNVGDIIRCFDGPIWRKTDGAEYTLRDTSALSSGEVSIIDPTGGPTEHVLLKIAGDGDIFATSDGDTVSLFSNVSQFFTENGTARVTITNIGAGTGQVVANPGTDSAFEFKSFRGGVGFEVTQTASEIRGRVRVALQSSSSLSGFDSGFDAWDPISNIDLSVIDCISTTASCSASERLTGCSCGLSFNPARVMAWLKRAGSGSGASCTCEGLIGTVSVPPDTIQTVSINARAFCLQG